MTREGYGEAFREGFARDIGGGGDGGGDGGDGSGYSDGGGGGDDGGCWIDDFEPNPECYDPPPPPTPAPPPPPNPQELCETAEIAYVTAYLSQYGSPLAADASQIVTESDEYGIDDRFIVALAGVETTYGTRGANSWGTNNVFNDGHQSFSSISQAINTVIQMLTTSTNPDYADLLSVSNIYSLYEEGSLKKVPPAQGTLNTIYGKQLGGNLSDVKFSRCP